MDEIARLHEFTLRLAQRLFLAAETLAIKAERRKPKGPPMTMATVPLETEAPDDLPVRLEHAARGVGGLFPDLMREAARELRRQAAEIERLTKWVEEYRDAGDV